MGENLTLQVNREYPQDLSGFLLSKCYFYWSRVFRPNSKLALGVKWSISNSSTNTDRNESIITPFVARSSRCIN
jgi:hypothetical protein